MKFLHRKGKLQIEKIDFSQLPGLWKMSGKFLHIDQSPKWAISNIILTDDMVLSVINTSTCTNHLCTKYAKCSYQAINSFLKMCNSYYLLLDIKFYN